MNTDTKIMNETQIMRQNGEESAQGPGRAGQKKQESFYVHKVGTISCGITLVLYGVLFLIHMVFPLLDYKAIFALWPLILVILGVEILLGCRKKGPEGQKFVYDFPAVLIVAAMMFFSFIMAALDYGIRYGGMYYGI